MRRFLAFCLLVALLAMGVFLSVVVRPFGPEAETFVELTPGMGTEQIAALLESKGVVRNQYAFDLWRLVSGGRLQAGEYRFAGPASLRDVYDRIRRGDVYYQAITIPEGFNLFDIAGAVESAGLGSRTEFLSAARKDTALVADLDPNATNLEGYLFPDTYRFQRHQKPDQILGAMVKRFRKAAASMGLNENFHHVVTLGSLVEKETPVGEDRPIVASVFENRLAKSMPLMTDPTVIYAALLENRYRGEIYASDLRADSPYNTYRHAGLPPGPICSPGFAALQAAAHPAKTSYLYFVANADAPGHSRFASTLEEHDRNVQSYRKALKAVQP